MPTPAKKSAPRAQTGNSGTVDSYAKDAALDVLLRKAFPYGQYAHIDEWLENQSLADEVRAEIAAAVERNA